MTIPLRGSYQNESGLDQKRAKPLNEIGKRYLELLRIAITEEFDQTLAYAGKLNRPI